MPFQTIDFNRFKQPPKRSKRWRVIAAIIAGLIVLLAIGFYLFGSSQADKTSNATTLTPSTPQKTTDKQAVSSKSQTEVAPAFDTKQFSNDDPNSIWIIANKQRPLQPKEFVPTLGTPNVPLRRAAGAEEMMVATKAIPDLEAMFAAAKQDGLQLMVASAYRSYSLQVGVYGNEVKSYGQATADTQSARPGFSEHQTGLAVDIEPASRQCEIQDCFGDTPEGKWLVANAHDYGFVLRYTPDGEHVTGYRHETWHFRYIGKEAAAEVYKRGNPPLETFFGLPPAPGYL